MLTALSAVVPTLLLVLLGYIITRAGVLGPNSIPTLSAYVVKIGLPALIFVNVYGYTLSDILNVTYLLTYAIAATVMVLLARAWSKSRRLEPATAATLSLAVSGTNNGIMGFPIFLLFIPSVAGLAVGMDMLVDNTLIIPLGLFLFEAASADEGKPWERRLLDVVIRVVTHPLVVAIALALLLTATRFELPEILDSAVTAVANSSPAVALFSIGGMLVGMKLGGQGADLAASVIGKLLVMPIISVGLVLLLPALGLPALTPGLRIAAVLTCALPSMSIVGPLSEGYGEGSFGAATVMASTVISFVTLTGWMLALTAVGWA